MRKELLGILLFFIVAFSAISLLSYSPLDPSIANPMTGGQIHNLFGLIGAHISGLFIFLFGLGAGWIPVILGFASYYIFNNRPKNEMLMPAAGALILVITSSGIFALGGDSFEIFGNKISSGGVIGINLNIFIVRYFNNTGGFIVLSLIWIIGFVLAAETSIVIIGNNLRNFTIKTINYFKSLYLSWKNRGKLPERIKKARPEPIPVKKAAQIKNIARKIKMLDMTSIPPKPIKKMLDMKKEEDADLVILKNDETSALPVKTSKPDNDKNTESEPGLKKENNSNKLKNKQAQTNNDQEPGLTELKRKKNSKYQKPVITFMNEPKHDFGTEDKEFLEHQAQLLAAKLEDFGVKGRVSNVIPGPVITTYEYKPAPGIKINKVVNLTDDLALALRAISIRIVAPIPGRAVIGIEVPNAKREVVWLKEIINSNVFKQSESILTICLGKDIVGNPVVAHLDKMPHLLIAGATGTGKSVGLNSMICSLLYKSVPEDVKMIMIDPKRIELTLYDGIPHLITPVVTDVKKATNALFWAVNEMERRYGLLAEKRVRNIVQYNDKVEAEKLIGEETEGHDKLPYIVIIIDELADLMVVASRDVEVSLMRLAQMARAAGIHLILATQRPSVDVLTGIIKANFPTRLTFQVSSKIDSRTIIDTNGAQNLLGAGDMLFLPPGTARLQRIHGAYISEDELQKITSFLKDQAEPEYDESVLEPQANEKGKSGDEEYDERYDDAVALVTQTRQASISSIQRHLRIGYNRAARIIEVMEKEGIVGPSDGAKPRDVLVAGYDD
ncbi:DNA translocase [Desulfonema limicola]|uniref:DNA translocase n=1 Tax=Desulfonema limicola TaxID=45656 RepID=A0A975B4Z9_9BACT|nr:DNA translocase FtsK [Desulfonema limicola]QTA78891.1 DNA translocase [Desulfonema limicola]